MKKLIISALALTPALAFAQQGNLSNLQGLLRAIGNLVEIALPIVVGLALLAFFWGLVKFITNAHEEEKRKEGRQLMIWGVIGLFVMIAVWGLVEFVGDAVGIDPESDPEAIPTVPGL